MDELLAALRAAAEPTRLRILCLCAKGELTVSELMQILGQSQPRVSRHLKQMCSAGLLERHQEGAWAFFGLAAEGLAARTARALVAQVEPDDDMIAQDLRRLDAVRAQRAERARDYFRDNAETWHRIRTLHVDERAVEAAVLAHVPASPDSRLLDVGTGTGRMLQLLASRVGHAIGIDSSREMLALARANLAEPQYAHCAVRQADMYQLPWPDGSFDIAILHMVLHFADDPAAAVAEAARVLKPEGQLLIVDFASHNIEELRAKYAHRRLGFRPKEIETWCADAVMSMQAPQTLEGGALTVTIWEARKLPVVEPGRVKPGADAVSWIRGATL